MRWKESEFWKNASPSELLNFFQLVEESKDLEALVLHMNTEQAFCDLVFEYLWLFRTEEPTKKFLNDEKISSDLLIKFIYFGYGKQFLSGDFDSNAYFLRIRDLFNSAQSLRILSLEEEMDRDPTLKIHLLSNLDPQTWEAYFDILEKNNMTMQTLLGIFTNLRENEIRKILLNSPTLYYYLRMMMFSNAETSDLDKKNDNKKRLESILDSIHIWETFCNDIKNRFDFVSEGKLTPSKRNPERLSLVLRELIKVPTKDRMDILVYIRGNGAVVDNWEESTIVSALGNFDREGRFF
ncbi:hypothetical protein P3G55_05715 [Leptospira sp. 96542]|nr:hypothetical protein [Leptospira sp. 96542]